MNGKKYKIATLIGTVALTVGIHYGYVLEPLFGDQHWIHAIHGRFCYIPIVLGASWFGVRGGLFVATVISLSVLPFILTSGFAEHNLWGEWVEIIFYYAIAILTGWIIDREFSLRKKHEQTTLQLEKAHKLSLIGQMTASVAHEMKNPLASIKGGVEIIVDKGTSETEKKEFEQIVFSEIHRMDKTIKEFLDFSRPKETQMEKLDLDHALATVVKQVQKQADEKSLTISYQSTGAQYIKGDKEKIQQVFLNLLLNAMDASPESDQIKIHSISKDDQIVISIFDNGSGIPAKDLEKIFEPFYTTKSSGTGLGLAVVKTIIENHYGTIAFDSSSQGTTINLTFPLYGSY